VNENFDEGRARKIIEDGIKKIKREDIKKVIEKEEEIKNKIKGHLTKYLEDIELFFSLLKSFINGEYRRVPWFTIAAVTVLLLYILNPLDIIPDFVPMVGLLDDATVVSACMALIEKDLKAYKDWKLSKKGGKDERSHK